MASGTNHRDHAISSGQPYPDREDPNIIRRLRATYSEDSSPRGIGVTFILNRPVPRSVSDFIEYANLHFLNLPRS